MKFRLKQERAGPKDNNAVIHFFFFYYRYLLHLQFSLTDK